MTMTMGLAETVQLLQTDLDPQQIPAQLRPIDIGRVAVDIGDQDRGVLIELAYMARSGHAAQMEKALAEVAWGPITAAQKLAKDIANQEGDPVTSIRIRALTAALQIDRLGTAARIHPTNEAMKTLIKDKTYLYLRHLTRVDLSAKLQRDRNLKFHTVGRLARLAAGR